jgi:hypothetical protein
MKVDVEDGLYLARDGQLVKLDIADDGTKKVRLAPAVFDEVRRVQPAHAPADGRPQA